jgi:hypothetical protein
MKFEDIPQFTCDGNYVVNVSWRYLEEQLNHYKKEFNLQLDPDFQRPHVWTLKKQERYIEFILRGGKSSRDIYFNQPYWMRWKRDDDLKNPLVLVDGKQRLNAAKLFLNNKIKAFGCYYKEFEDSLHPTVDFIFHVNSLPTRKEVLQWYLDLNSGGVVHTEEELNHVRKLLSKEINRIDLDYSQVEARLLAAYYDKGIKRKAIKTK